MDLLSQHEAFLRAIFDNPEEDTTRLVYADFLQENGEEDRAEFIRVQCELAGNMGSWNHSDRYYTLAAREQELLDRLHPERRYLEPHEREQHGYDRGFRSPVRTLLVTSRLLANPIAERWNVVRRAAEEFGVKDLAVDPGLCLKPQDLELLLRLPCAQRVTDYFLNGALIEGNDYEGRFFLSRRSEPAITSAGVEFLTKQRGVRRITTLDLRDNDLDNDAAWALVNSPHLDNLKSLRVLEGNRFGDAVEQQLIERFGEKVVG